MRVGHYLHTFGLHSYAKSVNGKFKVKFQFSLFFFLLKQEKVYENVKFHVTDNNFFYIHFQPHVALIR